MLELVVVVVILAFAITPLVMSSRSSIQSADYAIKRAMAANLATRMVERFSALDYEELRERLGTTFNPDEDPLLAPATYPDFLKERLADYAKTVTFQELVTDKLGMVQVEVRWYTREGSPQSKLKASKVVVNGLAPGGPLDDG